MLASRRLAAVLVFGLVIGACTIASLLGLTATAHAQATLVGGFGGTVGYGTQCLSPNDDGSGAVIDLTPSFPGGLKFFSGTHTTAYVNTNGNITFSGPVSTFTPAAFPVAAQPMIAPYWGDVDIRYTGGSCMGSAGITCTVCAPCLNPTENGVWWYMEPGRMVVTWDRVGYYSCHNDKRMNFQLILTSAGCGGAGDFDVEFRYNQCEWETGDASGGSGGFGGTEAQAGFDAGNGIDFVAIAGSMAPGIASTLCTSSNVGDTGVWRFQIRSGSVVCPDAGAPCDTGLAGVCAGGRTNCVGTGVECLQDVEPSPEQCDALDNDCDGQTDENDSGTLCPGGKVCLGGNCVLPCFEFVCDVGEVCSPEGLCIDEACVGVTCPEGERCEEGVCVGACDGVVCPAGQVCRAGHCLTLCDGLTCDDCTVCEDGVCIGKCEFAPCPVGEMCQPDGLCLEDACVGVTCAAGEHCVGGACVDSCTGAVCPDGQTCEVGECVPLPPPPDAGPRPDGNPGSADAGPGNPDAGPGDPDAGGEGGSSSSGCGCRTTGGPASAPAAGLLLLGLAALLGRRFLARRRR